MAQNRKPPAYQEYASAMLASKSFKLMSLVERGLLYTIRLECWENKEVPANIKEMAKYLGFDYQEINEALTASVKSFFKLQNEAFISIELEDYRQHLEQIRIKKMEGGKVGAAKTNSKNRQLRNSEKLNTLPSDPLVNAAGEPPFEPQDSCGSLVKLSSEKQSQDQSLVNNHEDKWIHEYDDADLSSYQTLRG